jgi:hypothetical protein
MTLGTSGLAVGLYSLLRLWVETKNGRKLRIKIGDFEVEGTQMTPEQFQSFVELTMQHLSIDEFLEKTKALKKEIASHGFTVVEQDEAELMRERRPIRDAVYTSQRQVREKIRKKLAEEHKDEQS